jgi:hypothetical protein
MGQRYRTLDAAHVVATIERLAKRIEERFPSSGLAGVARELLEVGREAAARSESIRRPHFGLRFGATLIVAAAITAAGFSVWSRLRHRLDWIPHSGAELLSSVNDTLGAIVFLGAAVVFLFSLETRTKRRKALAAIHELRSLAHNDDMHQLTKDPERLLAEGPDTPSSPERRMSPFELGRYLDYCSESLALISKVGALYVQGFEDSVAVSAVDEIESLTTGLSRKIWQKIHLIDRGRG